MNLLLLTAGVACLASAALTPIVRRLARRWGAVDHPDTHRKLHAKPVSLGGGVAVVLAIGVSIAVVFLGSERWRVALQDDVVFLVGFGGASLGICILGLLDDRFELRGRQKLIGQIAATACVVASGLVIREIEVFDCRIQLGLLAVPFTIFWLLGAINALNLLDGVDGLATSVGIVLSVSLGAIAYMNGHYADAVLALAMAGALCGFLLYNFPPASIYLGDAGSMLIGLVLGVIAIRGSLKGPATVAMAAPTAIWAIPLFDTAIAILRRKLTGRSIYETDRGHLHHTLVRRGLGGVKTLALVGAMCCITAVGALLTVHHKNELMAAASVAIVLSTLVMCRLFGHHECLLLLRRTKNFLISLVRFHRRTQQPSKPLCARLQGDHTWEDLWETLKEIAEQFELSAVQLNVSLPAIHEEYHATWQRKALPEGSELCRVDIPLVANHVSIGRLKMTGACQNGSVCAWMEDLVLGLRPFEKHVTELVEQRPALRSLQTTPGPAASLDRVSTPLGENLQPELATAEEI